MDTPVGATAKQVEDLMIQHFQEYHLTALDSAEEAKFQRDLRASDWYRGFVRAFGEPPDLNDPNYDYRGAWKAGLVPNAPGEHWPTQDGSGHWLKGPEYPTIWKSYFMEATGQDPDKLGLTQEDYLRAQAEARQYVAPSAEPSSPQQPETLDVLDPRKNDEAVQSLAPGAGDAPLFSGPLVTQDAP